MRFFKNDKNEFVFEEKEGFKEVIPNSIDASKEKHVPVINQDGKVVTVVVGDVIHPMLDNHYITFIILETNKGCYKKDLNPGEEPKAVFTLKDQEEVLHAYEFCNLHGLWVK